MWVVASTLQIINWKVAKLFSMTPFENISNVLTEGGMKKLQKDRNAMIFLAFDAENKLYTQNKSASQNLGDVFYTSYAKNARLGSNVEQVRSHLNLTGYPTSGFAAFAFAIQHCTSVSLYGYGMGNSSKMAQVHNFTDEVEKVYKFIRQGEIEVFHVNDT